MSFQAKRELLAKVAPRYREANRSQKTVILNEFIASTGYKRKYAIRLLSLKEIPIAKCIKRNRSPGYGKDVLDALLVAWAAANYIASKRLAPFLKELVPSLERHGYLKITNEVRDQLISISPATIDRLLRSWKSQNQIRGKSLTSSGKLLKHQIPVRTFADWEDKNPGFFEADLVVHCGCSASGSFLYTLVLTDIATGWIECMPLLNKGKHNIIDAIERARKLIPFPMLGLDTDNGTEFINNDLITYCKKEQITFTRGRAYKKNDQCFVEQKNGAVVRQIVGYDRFEGQWAYMQMTELYRAVRLYINFFQPSMKLKRKIREKSKVKRTYDIAQTPFQRLKASAVMSIKKIEVFDSINSSLDPVRLLKQIEILQNALWKHAVLEPQSHPALNTALNSKNKLCFQPDECGLLEKPGKNIVDNEIIINPEVKQKRKYRLTKKVRAPRYWRTRKDPFEEVWDEICLKLEDNPERTASSLLLYLQERYPDKYNKKQLRTLQRRVQSWRAKAIITFNNEWINEEILSENGINQQLKAIIMGENALRRIEYNNAKQ